MTFNGNVFHPAGTVLPLSGAVCNVSQIIGDRVRKRAGGYVYSLIEMANLVLLCEDFVFLEPFIKKKTSKYAYKMMKCV